MYRSADTEAWKANSWQRHPWHAERRREPLFHYEGKRTDPLPSLTPASSVGLFIIAKRKNKEVGGLVCFIKVPSVCLHEGSSPPSVCWHHSKLCPLLRLLSEPGRQGQASRCDHSQLQTELSAFSCLASLILLLSWKHKRDKIILPDSVTGKTRPPDDNWDYVITRITSPFSSRDDKPINMSHLNSKTPGWIWIRFFSQSVVAGLKWWEYYQEWKKNKLTCYPVKEVLLLFIQRGGPQLWQNNCAPPSMYECRALKRAQVAKQRIQSTKACNVPVRLHLIAKSMKSSPAQITWSFLPFDNLKLTSIRQQAHTDFMYCSKLNCPQSDWMRCKYLACLTQRGLLLKTAVSPLRNSRASAFSVMYK